MKLMLLITGLAERIEGGGRNEMRYEVVGLRPPARISSFRRLRAYSDALEGTSKGHPSLVR